ncbi:PorT family protein, partial [Crocinitomix catalasitica]|nr:PorT family protein [Crocinitomix catalasitica]
MSLEENNKELKDFFRENYTDEAQAVSPKVWNGVATSLEGMRLAKGLPTSSEANNNEIKDFFSKAYSDAPLTVSPEVWANVAADLEAKREAVSRRRRGGYLMWAALIGISLLTTTYLLYPSDTEEETSQKVNQEKPAHSADSNIESGETDVANLKPSSDALVDEQASKNESNANQQFDQTSTSDVGVGSFDSDQKTKTKKRPSNENKVVVDTKVDVQVPKSDDPSEVIAIQNISDSPKTDVNNSTAEDKTNVTIAEQSNQTEAEINATATGTSTDENNSVSETDGGDQIDQVDIINNSTSQEKRDNIQITPLDKSLIDPIAVLAPVAQFPMIGVEIEKFVKKISPWELSLYAGTGRRNRFIVNDNNPEDLFNQKFHKLNPLLKRYRQSGITLGYNIGNHFTVNLGVQTAQWKYTSREFQKLIVKDPMDYEMDAPVGRVATNPEDLDDFYDTTPADTLLFRIRMHQNLRYFSVPLSLKIKFGTKKIQPYIRGGVAANFLFWQRTNLVFRCEGLVRDFERVRVEGLKKVHFSGQGAFGFQWELAPRISMFAEAQIDLPLSNFY